MGYLTFIGGIVATVVMVFASGIFEDSVLLGLVLLIGGCVASWIGSFMYFAMAQILEDTAAIRYGVNNAGPGRSVSSHATITHVAPTTPMTPAMAAEAAKEAPAPVEVKLTAKAFVTSALEYRTADGTFAYVKKNHVKLNDEAREQLADVLILIPKDSPEAVREAIEALKDDARIMG